MDKKCNQCNTVKDVTLFYYDKSIDNYRYNCKECHKERVTARIKADKTTYNKYRRTCHLRKTYGLSREEFDKMEEGQKGVCKICGKEETSKPNLSVDHCHKTNKIRGLLCGKCNTALGLVNDDVETLKIMIKYLEE